MRIVSLILALFFFSFHSNAQYQLKPFRVDGGVGYPFTKGQGGDVGIVLTIEPKYFVARTLGIGVRMEHTMRLRNFREPYGIAQGSESKRMMSFLATADYYFSKSYAFRPFAGAGAGVFDSRIRQRGYLEHVYATPWSAGYMARAGIEFSHFRCAIEANFPPETKIDLARYPLHANLEGNNFHVAVKIAMSIGGGPSQYFKGEN